MHDPSHRYSLLKARCILQGSQSSITLGNVVGSALVTANVPSTTTSNHTTVAAALPPPQLAGSPAQQMQSQPGTNTLTPVHAVQGPPHPRFS